MEEQEKHHLLLEAFKFGLNESDRELLDDALTQTKESLDPDKNATMALSPEQLELLEKFENYSKEHSSE